MKTAIRFAVVGGLVAALATTPLGPAWVFGALYFIAWVLP